MGVSIKLYSIKKANEIGEVGDLESELADAEENQVDLYKVYHDVLMVLRNNIEPYGGGKTNEKKAIFGNKINVQAGYRQCVGFIPTNEIRAINEWVKNRGIDTREGFAKIYDDLDEEVKQELKDLCSPDKDEMYEFYIEKLVSFYRQAEVDGNSVVICAE